MKLFHLSDLHLGKRVNGFSMIEDQKYILNQILKYIEEEQPDGMLIAGDVYDKSVPSIEAVDLLDHFLTKLMEMHVATFIISGNHDSPERLGFAAKLIRPTNIRISQAYDGTVKPEKLWDDYGTLNIYMLPFIKPLHVRMAYPESDITTYTEAVKEAISHMKIDPEQRNLLIAHQFVTGAMRTDSEEISLGGSDNVDVRVFDPFDYVALGHIHRAQRLTKDTVRYSGTPLKYSFSECRDKKSVTVIEMKEKGNIQIRFLPLIPLHDMREIKGSYEELTCLKYYEGTVWYARHFDADPQPGQRHFLYFGAVSYRCNVYLNGDLTYNQFAPQYKMKYNEIDKAYEIVVPLKQGSYNYQYMFVSDDGSKTSLSPTEGNFHQTENEYTIYVYHRPVGGRYDKLVGFKQIIFKQN